MIQRSFNHHNYQAFLDEHQLVASRCAECGQVFLPPRAICSRCYKARMEWQPLSGRGTVAGITTIYVGSSAMAAAGYTRTDPYVTAVVKLEEGTSICGQVVGTERYAAEKVTVGTRVQATFIPLDPRDPSGKRLGFVPVMSAGEG